MRTMRLFRISVIFSSILISNIGNTSPTKEEYIEKLSILVGETWGMKHLTMAGCETLYSGVHAFTEELLHSYFTSVSELNKSPENKTSQVFERAQKKIINLQNPIKEAYAACHKKILADRKLLFGPYLASVFDTYFVSGTFGNVYQEPKLFTNDFSSILDKEFTKHLIGLGEIHDEASVFDFFQNVIENLFQVRNKKFPTSPIVIFREHAGTIYNTGTPEGFAQNLLFHKQLQQLKTGEERMLWHDLMLTKTEEIIQQIKDDFASTQNALTVNDKKWYALYPADTLYDRLSQEDLKLWFSEQGPQEINNFVYLGNKMGEKNTYVWFDDLRYRLEVKGGTEILEFGKDYNFKKYSNNQSFLKHPFLTDERVGTVLSAYSIKEKPLPYLVFWGGNSHITPHLPNEFRHLTTTLAKQYPTASELTSIHAIGKTKPISPDTYHSLLDSGLIKLQTSVVLFEDFIDVMTKNPNLVKEHPIAVLHTIVSEFRQNLTVFFKTPEFNTNYEIHLDSLDTFLENIRDSVSGLGNQENIQEIFNDTQHIVTIEKALLDGCEKAGDLKDKYVRDTLNTLKNLMQKTQTWASQNFEEDIWSKVLALYYVSRGVDKLASESGYAFYLTYITQRSWELPKDFTIKTLSDAFIHLEPAFPLILGALLAKIPFADPEMRNVQKKLTSKILDGMADRKGLYIYSPAPATEAQKITVLTDLDFLGD